MCRTVFFVGDVLTKHVIWPGAHTLLHTTVYNSISHQPGLCMSVCEWSRQTEPLTCSYARNLMAVSGAILSTLIPFPLQRALSPPSFTMSFRPFHTLPLSELWPWTYTHTPNININTHHKHSLSKVNLHTHALQTLTTALSQLHTCLSELWLCTSTHACITVRATLPPLLRLTDLFCEK